MQLNSIFPRASGRIVSVKLVWIHGNPGWNINRHLTVFTANLLVFRSVTVIIGIRALGFLITQMF